MRSIIIFFAWCWLGATFSFAADTPKPTKEISLISNVDGAEIRLPLEIAHFSKTIQLQIDTLGKDAVSEQGIFLQIEGLTLTRIVAALIARGALGESANIKKIYNKIAAIFLDVNSLDEVNKFFHAANFLDIEDFYKPTAQLLLDCVAQLAPKELQVCVKNALCYCELNVENMNIPAKFSEDARAFGHGVPYAAGDKIIYENKYISDIFDRPFDSSRSRRFVNGQAGSRLIMAEGKFFVGRFGGVEVLYDNGYLSTMTTISPTELSDNGSEFINLIGTNLFATKQGSGYVSVIDTKENALRHTIALNNGEVKIQKRPLESSRYLFVLVAHPIHRAPKLLAIDGESEEFSVSEVRLPPLEIRDEARLHSVVGNLLILCTKNNYFVVDSMDKEMVAKPLELPRDLDSSVRFVEISKKVFLGIHMSKPYKENFFRNVKYFLFDLTTGVAHSPNVPTPRANVQFLGHTKNSLVFLGNTEDKLSIVVVDTESLEKMRSFSLEKMPTLEFAVLVDSELVIKFAKSIRSYDLKFIF